MAIILTTLANDSHSQQHRQPLLRLILILSLGGIAIATHSQQHERDLLQLRLILNSHIVQGCTLRRSPRGTMGHRRSASVLGHEMRAWSAWLPSQASAANTPEATNRKARAMAG